MTDETKPALTSPQLHQHGGGVDVDALAQEIRRVDGNHSLGAGALAEALLPFLTAALAQQPLSVPEPVSLDTLAGAFQDGFTNGNALWDDTPEYHKDAFREGARCLMEKQRYPFTSYWQPIETAPKDGTQIIVFTRWAGDTVTEPFEKTQIASWNDGNDLDPSDDFYREGGWDLQFIGDPMFWQHLPAHPTQSDVSCSRAREGGTE